MTKCTIKHPAYYPEGEEGVKLARDCGFRNGLKVSGVLVAIFIVYCILMLVFDQKIDYFVIAIAVVTVVAVPFVVRKINETEVYRSREGVAKLMKEDSTLTRDKAIEKYIDTQKKRQDRSAVLAAQQNEAIARNSYNAFKN